MIPKEWDIQPLSEIATVTSGGTPSRTKPEYWQNGTVPWIRTTEVQNCVLNPEDVKEYISEQGLKNSSAKLVPAGTILLAMIGQGKTRGQVALLKFEASTNQNAATIVFNKDQEPEFHFNFLLSQYENIRGMSNSAGQSNLSGALVKAIKVPVPPLPEQKKIAQILSTWDKAITTTEQLLSNSQQQKKALMQQLLTGKKRLLDDNGQKFSGEWEEIKLKELFCFKRGKGLSKSAINKDGHNKCILYGELFTHYPEVVSKVLSKTDEGDSISSVEGDILIPSSTTTSGIDLANATALLESNVLLGGDINILRPKESLSSEFFAYLLTHIEKRQIASFAQGITIIHIYGSDLKKVKVKVSVNVREQQKIAAVLTSADQEIDSLQQKIEALKQEKKALMQQLLTGKRRVKLN